MAASEGTEVFLFLISTLCVWKNNFQYLMINYSFLLCLKIMAADPPLTPAPLKIRDDWYQTETHVAINILVKNMKQDDVSITYGLQMVC